LAHAQTIVSEEEKDTAMKTPKNAIWKLVIVLCLITLPACQFRERRNQEPSVSLTPESSSANPVVPSMTTIATSSDESAADPLAYVTGSKSYFITVDDTRRSFIVYVPGGYDPSRPTPVVIAYHASNHNGGSMYKETNWAAKAEQENFIVVFPTSWKYLLTSSNQVEAKWYDLVMEVTEPTVEFKDDVHFTRAIIESLKATFNVDEKRIYATGSSNGGYFVISRLLVQMSDVFAAFATAQVGPDIQTEVDTSVIKTRTNTSLYKIFGTQDGLVSKEMGLPLPFPFRDEDILNHPNFKTMLLKTTTVLDLDISYTVQSDPNFTTLTFDRSLVGADNEFIFQMLRGMGHLYPDGENNPAGLDAADVFWDFFMRHSKP
jgi:poly(3-hydroxybutyrate) depolymerase